MIEPVTDVTVFSWEYASVLQRLSPVASCNWCCEFIMNLESTMELESRIVALEQSLNRQHARSVPSCFACFLLGWGWGQPLRSKTQWKSPMVLRTPSQGGLGQWHLFGISVLQSGVNKRGVILLLIWLVLNRYPSKHHHADLFADHSRP